VHIKSLHIIIIILHSGPYQQLNSNFFSPIPNLHVTQQQNVDEPFLEIGEKKVSKELCFVAAGTPLTV